MAKKEIKKVETVKEEPKREVEQPKEDQKVNPFTIPCVNLKLSVKQLNGIRSSLLCKVATLQIKLENSIAPQEIEIVKTEIAELTQMIKELTGILNQAITAIQKQNEEPSIPSSVDPIKKN